MKRLVGVLVFVSMVAAALAQAPFTIVRPADGSKVREQIKILLPKNSIPEGGYVGVYLNGKFIEAMVPSVSGNFYEYILDTKERKIPEGKANIELVLYVDYGTEHRVLDRSSVDVQISNTSSIKVPTSGYLLRYYYSPGRQYIYEVEQKVLKSSITKTQEQLGARAAEQAIKSENFRMLYSIDNRFENGDGLIRMQALPEPGKDYAFLSTITSPEPKKYYDNQMSPVYMRATNTGLEVFGSIPPFVPLEGNSAQLAGTNLYATYPWPTLPTKAVRPGDVWQSRFQLGALNLADRFGSESVTAKVPARGEFLGVEWEMGRPCAKIRHSISVSTLDEDAQKALGGGISGGKIQMEETIWFALDRKLVVKGVRNFLIELRTQTQNQTANNAQGTPGAAPGGLPPGLELPPGVDPNDPRFGNARLQALGAQRGAQGRQAPAQGQPVTRTQRLRVEQTFVLQE